MELRYPEFTPTGFLFDIDNTLTNSERVVTFRTQQALKNLQLQGFLTSMCTGRGWCVLKDNFAPLFRETDIHITMGGAQIVRNNGEVLWENLLEHEVVKDLCHQFDQIGAEYSFIVPQGYVATPEIYEYYGKIPKRSVPLLRPDEQEVWRTGSITVGWETPELVAILEQTPGISYRKMWHSSQAMFYEVTVQGVNKETGAKKWEELVGTSLSTTVGCGDNGNDIEFLQTVGFAVAMGNATPEILKIGDVVVNHCDQDGLAEWLEHFV